MKLFVFSYPSHYKLTRLAAYYAVRHIKGIGKIVYVWDDFHTDFTIPAGLFSDETVLKFSDFEYTSTAPNGWIRQQFVKLQLHKICNDQSIYVLDGDTLIRNDIDLCPDKMIQTFEYSSQYFNFIKHSLRLVKQNTFSFISPLLRLEPEVLAELESYTQQFNNGKNLMEIFLSCDKTNMNFSEAEIYGTFATQILGKKFKYESSQFNEYGDIDMFQTAFHTTTKNLVYCGTEDRISNFLDLEYTKLVSLTL